MAVKVSSKYQVVIPEHVRNILQIKPGMEMDVIAKGSVVYLVPIPSLASLKVDLEGKLDGKKLREKKDRM